MYRSIGCGWQNEENTNENYYNGGSGDYVCFAFYWDFKYACHPLFHRNSH